MTDVSKLRNRYQVAVMAPADWPHLPIFLEIAELIQHSLISVGHVAPLKINRLMPFGTNIVLGSFMMDDPKRLSTGRCIIYQLEQLSERDERFQTEWVTHLRNAHLIWDYSPQNIEALKAHGITNVRHVPFGYHPAMRKVPKSSVKDIDVLFYGAVNERRRAIMRELQEKKVQVGLAFGTYGALRDELIARSKIVLNIHLHDAKIFEQSRVSYLLNNDAFVISEDAPDVPYQSIVTAPYDELVATCLRYLEQPEERDRIARESAEHFRSMPMQDFIVRGLE